MVHNILALSLRLSRESKKANNLFKSLMLKKKEKRLLSQRPTQAGMDMDGLV